MAQIKSQIPQELVGNTSVTDVFVEGIACKALLDTRSTVSKISEDFYRQYLPDIPVVSLNKLLQVQSVTGDELPYLGYIEVDLAVSTFSNDPQ